MLAIVAILAGVLFLVFLPILLFVTRKLDD